MSPSRSRKTASEQPAPPALSEPVRAWQPIPEDEQTLLRRVGHALNNHLTLVLGHTQRARRKLAALSPAEVAARLAEIESHALDMRATLDAFMRLNQIQHSEPEIAPLHMAEAVDLAVRGLSEAIAQRNAALFAPEAWPVALGDLYWVRDVWSIYLSNALKYGGSPCRVTLGADAPDAGQIRFWVRDNGAGLPPEAQAGLFKPFFWPTATRTGVGLGLYTARVIVTRLGGTVSAASAVGQGSTFSFTLPVPASPCAPPPK